MRTFIIGTFMIVLGLTFGVALTEVSLRTFMPELAKTQTVDTGYIENIGAQSDAQLNADGYREARTLADLTEKDWIALGGSTAFGANVKDDELFTKRFEELTGLKVYNAAQNTDGTLDQEFAALAKLQPQTKANKVVYVVDLGVPPSVLLGEKEAPKKGQSFLDSLVLMKVLKGNSTPQEQAIPAWTEQQARKYAEKLAQISAPYRTNDEHFIVLLAPARGHTFENSYGTIHRKNQELVAKAVRSYPGVYAVDLSFLIKMDYANPGMLYDDNNRLNAQGHRMLASGFLKQFEVFSTWKSFDELTPEEQAQVQEDMRRTQEEEARKNAENPFK